MVKKKGLAPWVQSLLGLGFLFGLAYGLSTFAEPCDFSGDALGCYRAKRDRPATAEEWKQAYAANEAWINSLKRSETK